MIYHPIVTSFLWKATVRLLPSLRAKVPYGNLIIVRYEDLVKNSEGVVQNICKLLDEEFEKDMLDVTFNNSSIKVNENGIFSSSIGRWRTSLSNEEAYISQLINRKELIYLGYKSEKIQPNFTMFINMFASLPFALLKGIGATKEGRGHIIPYISRRIAGFMNKI